jgi:hypothetical protein
MLDAVELMRKHRAKGVLIDTNLLVLYLVGTVNRGRILNFKRTADFTVRDYDQLVRLIKWFGKIIATPHVLSQVSDLTDLSGHELIAVRKAFKSQVEKIDEHYDASRVIVEDPSFEGFGLTDAAIASASSRGLLVLTTDTRPHLVLQTRGIDALNFNHLRLRNWGATH